MNHQDQFRKTMKELAEKCAERAAYYRRTFRMLALIDIILAAACSALAITCSVNQQWWPFTVLLMLGGLGCAGMAGIGWSDARNCHDRFLSMREEILDDMRRLAP